MVPQPILDAIRIADELAQDPDLEDGHDCERCDDDMSVDDGEEDAQIAPRRRAVVLNDTAEDDDDRDPPVSYFAWGHTPKGEPGKCFQPPRPPNSGGHREGYSHRLGDPVQVGVGIQWIGTRPEVAKPGLGTPARDGKGGTHG